MNVGGLILLLLIVGVVLALVPIDATIKRIIIGVIVVVLVFALLRLLAPSLGGVWI